MLPFLGRQNQGPEQMTQRSSVAALIPAVAFSDANRYSPPLLQGFDEGAMAEISLEVSGDEQFE